MKKALNLNGYVVFSFLNRDPYAEVWAGECCICRIEISPNAERIFINAANGNEIDAARPEVISLLHQEIGISEEDATETVLQLERMLETEWPE